VESAGAAEGIAAVASGMLGTTEPEKLFQAGVVFLEKLDRVGDALMAFKKAHELVPDDSRYASYYGLCLALAKRDTREAVPICMDAIRRDIYRPELFLNLGRVYLLKRDRGRAHEAFMMGLRLDRRDPRIRRELRRMGIRRRPIFPFLDRDHLLNRWLGRLLSRYGLR
jgi:tetratricopeptide (TPR) repeat protein